MWANLDAGAFGLVAVLLFTIAIGVGLAWIGAGYWRHQRSTRDGVAARAKIVRLGYDGYYLQGRTFAALSFRDASGASHAANLSLTPYQWRGLREGAVIPILYSAADPQCVSVGGNKMRRLYQAAGVIFSALGVLIAAFMTWFLIEGLLGWGGVTPINLLHEPRGIHLTPPRPSTLRLP